MIKNKKIIYSIALVPVVIILLLFVWFLAIIFEGEKPTITIQPMPEFLSGNQKLTLNLSDMKRGLRTLKVSLNQEGKEIPIHEERFPFKGFLNRGGVNKYQKEISIDPIGLKLPQGRVDLNVNVWDYSKRGGGDGNMTVAHHKMIVDTIPPSVRAMTRMHNVNNGGTGLVVYQTSSDTIESGVFVDALCFRGFPEGGEESKGIYICYFAVPFNVTLKPSIYLWAKDRAGNRSKTPFYFHLRRKFFRKEKINITDSFLSRILPYFSFYPSRPEDSDTKRYVRINQDLREENHKTFQRLSEKTSPKRLWEGTWLRLKNAATMARFADHRSYLYKDEKVDEQDHLGIDLASLANSPVEAANHGKVIFTGRLGIYGLTVVLDHGQGLASVYGHLSKIDVKVDQEVKRGDIVGLTGDTGLAGGDHLHFSVMVHGIFVNPIEWWDPHWIKDNITSKLALLKE
ncbi:MAG: M23 family metallopeptidase [Pseudomonadota bacterium]